MLKLACLLVLELTVRFANTANNFIYYFFFFERNLRFSLHMSNEIIVRTLQQHLQIN